MRWFLLHLLPQILLFIANCWGGFITGGWLFKKAFRKWGKPYRELKNWCDKEVHCIVTFVNWESCDTETKSVYRHTVGDLSPEQINEKYLRDKYPASEGWVSHYAYRSGEAPADQEWPSEVEVGDGLAH